MIGVQSVHAFSDRVERGCVPGCPGRGSHTLLSGHTQPLIVTDVCVGHLNGGPRRSISLIGLHTRTKRFRSARGLKPYCTRICWMPE
jgi:hypothetical protein